MEKILTINRGIQNTFEFEVTIEGLGDSDVTARFVITDGIIDYSFECSKIEKNKFRIDFPPLPMNFLNDDYQSKIEVIADGHFFVPVKGYVTVTQGKPEVKASEVKPILQTSSEKKEEKEKQSPEKKGKPKEEEKKEEEKTPEKKEEPKKEESKKKKNEEGVVEENEELDKIVQKAARSITRSDPKKDKAAKHILETLRVEKVARTAKREHDRKKQERVERRTKEKAILKKQKKNREIKEIIESTKPHVTIKY